MPPTRSRGGRPVASTAPSNLCSVRRRSRPGQDRRDRSHDASDEPGRVCIGRCRTGDTRAYSCWRPIQAFATWTRHDSFCSGAVSGRGFRSGDEAPVGLDSKRAAADDRLRADVSARCRSPAPGLAEQRSKRHRYRRSRRRAVVAPLDRTHKETRAAPAMRAGALWNQLSTGRSARVPLVTPRAGPGRPARMGWRTMVEAIAAAGRPPPS